MAARAATRSSGVLISADGQASGRNIREAQRPIGTSVVAEARRCLISVLLAAARVRSQQTAAIRASARRWIQDLDRMPSEAGPCGTAMIARAGAIFADPTRMIDTVHAARTQPVRIIALSRDLYLIDPNAPDQREGTTRREDILLDLSAEGVLACPSRSSGMSASDFIGLALVTVAGLPAPADPPSPRPITPALDALASLSVSADAIGQVDTRRADGETLALELAELCRFADLTARDARAIVATADEIARLLDNARRSTDRPDAEGISGTTIGRDGDNRAEAVVLARLFLMSAPTIRPDQRPSRRRPAPSTAAQRSVMPNYPAVDPALLRAIGLRHAARLPRNQRDGAIAALQAPVSRWDGDTVALSTLTVGSRDWHDLKRDAGYANRHLRVLPGTAIVLVDRSTGEQRSALRRVLTALASDALRRPTPRVAEAITAASTSFFRDLGQILVPLSLSDAELELSVDACWIDPRGRRHDGSGSLTSMADAAPMAAAIVAERAAVALRLEAAPWGPPKQVTRGGHRRLVVDLIAATRKR